MTITHVRTSTARVLAVLALAATAAIAALAAPAQASRPDPPSDDRPSYAITGCPYGAVCLYPGTGWNGGNPSHVYWEYGSHRLYEQYGSHRIYNNQWGGATTDNCLELNRYCTYDLEGGEWLTYYLTPVNYIRLMP